MPTGNWDFLAVNDCLQGFFANNQVVFLKHHPIRGKSLDPLVRKILAPLIEKGYFQSEVDMGVERSSEIVYSPHVSTVHLTGGKRTHDAIMWGSSPREQIQRKLTQDPKLKAEMTAEMGAVSPWIVPPADMTDDELDHLADSVASAVFNNASCNCNAPKVLVMSKEWKQADKFKELVKDHFSRFETPCAYYPGSKERWESTRDNMPGAQVVESKKELQFERNLKAPMLAKDDQPVVLPLLTMDVDVDLSTAVGRQTAKTQYAFKNEPFAPTITFTNMLDNGTVKDFLKKGVEFANDFCFGTLSCTITVPPGLEGTDPIEQAIADLHYGQIVVNAWAAIGFVAGLPWGGYPPKENKPEAVETGKCKIFNPYFFPHVVKAVIRTPMIADNHYIKPVDFPDPQGNIDALKFFVDASIEPAPELDVELSSKEVQKIAKLEAQFRQLEVAGKHEEMNKLRDQITAIWKNSQERTRKRRKA